MMSNVILRWTDGYTTYDYKIEGTAEIKERKNQMVNQLSFPAIANTIDENGAVLNTLFGQTLVITGSFIIMDRSDDYTNGTGSPSTYSKSEQWEYIKSYIHRPVGENILIDEEGTSFTGKIESIEKVNRGDDPLKYDIVFTFKVGIVPYV